MSSLRIRLSPTRTARTPACSSLRMSSCVWIPLSLTSTFLYFQQASIVSAAFDNPAERTRVFALIDLAVGIATILVGVFVATRPASVNVDELRLSRS